MNLLVAILHGFSDLLKTPRDHPSNGLAVQ